MAELFRATLTQAAGEDRVVVVKRMLPRIASDVSARAMFSEEARLGTHIRHRNVVQVIDYGVADDNPFIVLEFVHGVDLWRLMRFLTRTGRSLSVAQAVFIAREMLLGLHAVHEARDECGVRLGVVHRDVSPSNVLLSVHGDVKLGDLGIARSRLREKFPSTALSERAKGKLGYLAPEQVRGSESDRRADIFSAGVVTAELLMGRPLFAGGSELAVLLAIRDSKIHPFLEFATQLPEGLGDVVVEALAQKPARRHATAELFASRLLPFQTEPAEVLRKELAQLVLDALETGPTPLAAQLTPTRTVTHPEALFDQADAYTAPSPDQATPIRVVQVAQGDAKPVQGPIYTVQTTTREALGPWSFAQIVQAISTGKLSPLDQVSVDEATARPLSELPELARHLPSSTLTTGSLDAATSARLSGEILPLDDGGIVLALARAAVERTTALLLCELGGVRKEVYVKDGAPAFVTSNLAGELLGEHLVSHGVISRGELDMALAVMPRFEGRLGDTLSALGLVEPVVLFRHIASQVRQKLLDLFLWTSGSCTHYHGVAPPPSGFPLNIDAWEVLDEGLRMRIDKGLEEPRLQLLRTRRVLPATGAQLSAMRAALPLRMKRLLTELDRPRSIPELMVKLADRIDPEQLVRDAVLLLHLNALRPAE
jgi:serine/threonine protein kinase